MELDDRELDSSFPRLLFFLYTFSVRSEMCKIAAEVFVIVLQIVISQGWEAGGFLLCLLLCCNYGTHGATLSIHDNVWQPTAINVTQDFPRMKHQEMRPN